MTPRELYPEGKLVLRELGLRDGLQLVKKWPSTAGKIEWLNRAYEAGVRHFEVGSFLPHDRFPQFADIRQLVDAVAGLPEARSSALTLNERAISDALATAVDEIVIAVSATEEHSLANIRRTRKSAVGLIRTAVEERAASSRPTTITAAISMAFGCSISGDVAVADVVQLAEECLEAGAEVIGVADTVGYAGPAQVAEVCEALIPRLDGRPLIVHLHDTRGTGLANAHAALQSGVRILDGTLAGLGGCPFAPGATGNVVFEDLAYLCERCGFRTGIDLEKLIAVRTVLEAELAGETLHGAMAKAGVPGKIAWQTANSDTPQKPKHQAKSAL